MKKILALLTLFSLISCGGGNSQTKENQKPVSGSDFPISFISDKPAIKGGVFKEAIVQSYPFKGLLSDLYADTSDDTVLVSKLEGDLFLTDENFNYADGGMMTMRYDVDKNVVNLKLKKGLVWEDGAPITMDDYIYVYKVLASPKYNGTRYDDSIRNVKGIEDYHKGLAKDISGLEKVNDYELNINLVKPSPFVNTLSGGLVAFIIPYHYLKDVPIDKLEQSDKIRLKPLSYGPYKVSQIIPGESIEYSINENYYDKKNLPKVDKYIVKILPDTSVISSMRNGEFDIYDSVTGDIYPEYRNFDNQHILGQLALYYQYIGFNLGYWDNEKGENIQDPNAKLANIELRKAIAYALDLNSVAKNFYSGLRIKANSIIPPVFKDYYDPKPRYDYNPEKAKEILDKLGYKDIDGDGYREDPQGKPFVIDFAFPSFGDIAEPLSSKYIQDWKAVGLNVKLATGRLINGAAFFPLIKSNKGFDIWAASWSVGSNFDPSSLYGERARFNFSRAVTPENTKLINEILSIKSIEDPKYKVEKIHEWEDNYMNNVLGFLPVLFRYDLIPVNKRIKEYSLTNDSREAVKFIDALTQKESFKSTK